VPAPGELWALGLSSGTLSLVLGASQLSPMSDGLEIARDASVEGRARRVVRGLDLRQDGVMGAALVTVVDRS
jgi:hypothetical protein